MIDGGQACSVCDVARKGFLCCLVLSVHTSCCYICVPLLAIFHSCTVHFDVIQSFISPTNAQ
jgi:hypothetical protein